MMDKKSIENKLKEAILKIAPEFEKHDINWDTNLIDDLLFDSLRMIELIILIEDLFEVEVMGELMSTEVIGTFKGLYEVVVGCERE